MRSISNETSFCLSPQTKEAGSTGYFYADHHPGCLYRRNMGRVAAVTMKDNKWPEEAVRYCTEYRGSKLYVIVTETSIGFSTENRDQFMTISALRLFEEAFTLLLEDNSLEDLAGLANTCSLCTDDLPRVINDAIVYYMEHVNGDISRKKGQEMVADDRRREHDVKSSGEGS